MPLLICPHLLWRHSKGVRDECRFYSHPAYFKEEKSIGLRTATTALPPSHDAAAHLADAELAQLIATAALLPFEQRAAFVRSTIGPAARP
jgi:hypothetical protein